MRAPFPSFGRLAEAVYHRALWWALTHSGLMTPEPKEKR